MRRSYEDLGQAGRARKGARWGTVVAGCASVRPGTRIFAHPSGRPGGNKGAQKWETTEGEGNREGMKRESTVETGVVHEHARVAYNILGLAKHKAPVGNALRLSLETRKNSKTFFWKNLKHEELHFLN